jgi:hypothetical protein
VTIARIAARMAKKASASGTMRLNISTSRKDWTVESSLMLKAFLRASG